VPAGRVHIPIISGTLGKRYEYDGSKLGDAAEGRDDRVDSQHLVNRVRYSKSHRPPSRIVAPYHEPYRMSYNVRQACTVAVDHAVLIEVVKTNIRRDQMVPRSTKIRRTRRSEPGNARGNVERARVGRMD